MTKASGRSLSAGATKGRSRDPGERPRNSAVSIEAGFVPSTEPEPDYVEEIDEEEEIIEADNGREDSEEDDGEERPAASGERSERGGDRGDREGGRGKRRRRGGRGRNRDRDGGPRPTGADTGVAAPAPLPVEGQIMASADDSEFEPAQPGAPLDENGQPRRKRRRRRGRRGGRDRADRPQGENGTHAAEPVDRFGAVPDEIDTTPTDARHAPGAPSTPVWSLKDDIPDTTPTDDKPSKKGWWQKAFGGE